MFCVFSITVYAQNTNYNWSNDYREVLKEAKTQQKFIVLYFSDSQNSDNNALQATIFETEAFKRLTTRALLLKVHALNSEGIAETETVNSKRVIGHYNPEEKFPALLLLNSKGEVLGEMLTDWTPETINAYLDFLKSTL